MFSGVCQSLEQTLWAEETEYWQTSENLKLRTRYVSNCIQGYIYIGYICHYGKQFTIQIYAAYELQNQMNGGMPWSTIIGMVTVYMSIVIQLSSEVR
jgi:hypothetical protein